MDVRELRAGDLIVYPAEALGRFQHTAIVVNQNNLVHADTDFLKIEPIDDTDRYCPVYGNSRLNPYAYRCRNGMLAATAANYALRFGRNAIGAEGVTVFGTDRARGVTQQLRTAADPPFEFDAIYRALKWALGGGKGSNQFSQNHGTTCAAFVIACYQAAAIHMIASGSVESISSCFETIKSWRVGKKDTKADRWKKTPKQTSTGVQLRTDAYKRGVSNVGVAKEQLEWARPLDDAQIAREAWDTVGASLVGDDTFCEPEHYMTGAMKVDAKFCFTETLKKRMDEDQFWVRKVLYLA